MGGGGTPIYKLYRHMGMVFEVLEQSLNRVSILPLFGIMMQV